MSHCETKENGVNLWSLIEALQERFEALGLEEPVVDAAVIGRVNTLGVALPSAE